VQKLGQASSFVFASLRGSGPFCYYVVTADVGTMGKNRDEGNTANWRISGWSSSWLSISMAVRDGAPTIGLCARP